MSNEASNEKTIQSEFAELSSLFSSSIDEDPYPYYKSLRLNHPVRKGDFLAEMGVPSMASFTPGREHHFTLTRYDDCLAIFRDPATYTNRLVGDGLGRFLGGYMLTGMDGAEHDAARALLQPCFAPRYLSAWRDRLIIPLAQDYSSRLASRGRCELVNDYALPYPVHVIYRIIGFPDEQSELEQFAAWGLKMIAGSTPNQETAETAFSAAMDASQKIYTHTLAMVQRRRAEGSEGDDLIGNLLRASYQGDALNDEQIASFIRMLLPAAAETTTRSISNLMFLLLQNPSVMEEIRADRSLVGKAITESMRLEPVAAWAARETSRDVEIRGVMIPKGSALSLCKAAAHRDEEVFDRPDAFDIHRPLRPSFGFGFGVHMCIGMHIAKMEIEACINSILDQMPQIRLDPDFPPPKLRGLQLRGPSALRLRWD